MSQLNLIFSCYLVKLFNLNHMLILSLIVLLMASGEEGFNILSLILEFSTLVHRIHLNLLTTTMSREVKEM